MSPKHGGEDDSGSQKSVPVPLEDTVGAKKNLAQGTTVDDL